MSASGEKKRKSKSWYRKQAFINKRQKTYGKSGHRLTPGLKGFIVTCNDREQDAVKEIYNILNEYADKLYGPEKNAKANETGDIEEEDIEKALAAEVQEIKDAGKTVDRRFQNCLSGAKSCIFIKTTIDDPANLAYAIFTDLLQTKMQKCRYALRLLPVVGTCKANTKEISDLAKVVLAPYFTETKFEVTYSVNFKARNNSSIGRETIITSLCKTITDTFSSCLLRYTPVRPEIMVFLEVICGVACIGVARDFARFHKYNLVEVVNEKPKIAQQSLGTTLSEPLLSGKPPAVDVCRESNATIIQCEIEQAAFETENPGLVDSVTGTESMLCASYTKAERTKTDNPDLVDSVTDTESKLCASSAKAEQPCSDGNKNDNADIVAFSSDCKLNGDKEG